MCFTPEISLATAVVEFLLAGVILLRFRKSAVSRFAALFIIFLGAYQFSEFMLCITLNAGVWVRFGYIVYTFLPALGLHFILKLIKSKIKPFILYVPPIIYSVMALADPGFVVGGVCHSVFVSTEMMFLNPQADLVMSTIYTLYYAGFILALVLLAARQFRRENDKHMKKIIAVGLAGVLLATVPALIFIIIFPLFRIHFPSLYCEFALLMAIAAYIVSYLHHKYKPNIKK